MRQARHGSDQHAAVLQQCLVIAAELRLNVPDATTPAPKSERMLLLQVVRSASAKEADSSSLMPDWSKQDKLEGWRHRPRCVSLASPHICITITSHEVTAAAVYSSVMSASGDIPQRVLLVYSPKNTARVSTAARGFSAAARETSSTETTRVKVIQDCWKRARRKELCVQRSTVVSAASARG